MQWPLMILYQFNAKVNCFFFLEDWNVLPSDIVADKAEVGQVAKTCDIIHDNADI